MYRLLSSFRCPENCSKSRVEPTIVQTTDIDYHCTYCTFETNDMTRLLRVEPKRAKPRTGTGRRGGNRSRYRGR